MRIILEETVHPPAKGFEAKILTFAASGDGGSTVSAVGAASEECQGGLCAQRQARGRAPSESSETERDMERDWEGSGSEGGGG